MIFSRNEEPRHVLFVEIPKNGSRTAVRGIKNKYGTDHCPGHKPLSYLVNWAHKHSLDFDYLTAVAILRNPYDRFLSGLNYTSHRNSGLSLHERVEKIKAGQYPKVFSTQVEWLDTDEVPIQYFFSVESAMAYMGLPTDLHENKSAKVFTKKDIEHLHSFVEKHYAEDFDLITRLQHNGNHGPSVKRPTC